MKRTVPNALGLCLVKFFQSYLPSLRGVSAHTIRSYRDAIVLYLRFVCSETGKHPDQIDLDGFTAQSVAAFVTFLEHTRHNRLGTRNEPPRVSRRLLTLSQAARANSFCWR